MTVPPPPPPPERLIQVALPIPLFATFTYKADAAQFANPVAVGSRVLVPFRNRRELGICTAVDVPPPAKGKLKSVLDVPDAEPAVSAEMIQLCEWISSYYIVPLGMVLRSVLPAALTGAAQPNPSRKIQKIVEIRADIPSLLQREKAFARAPQQRALFELLESLGGKSSVAHLLEQLEVSPSVLKSLEKRALVTITSEEIDRDPFASRSRRPPASHAPTPEQAQAIQAMADARAGEVFLLHGITGSGKTLVYIELLRKIVEERGQTGIVLVPEISLTPQTVDRFRAVFGDSIAVLHSALSDGERYDAWLALKRGEKRIAVGARSAIFAPLTNLGAIIVDEEHETSYKQGEAPRYHAREVAIVRARNEGAIVVLGSATPSLESWVNVLSNKYKLLKLPERVGGGALPKVEVVNLRRSKKSNVGERVSQEQFVYSNIISAPLDTALAARLQRNEQSILLLNRRGYSSFVQCNECGYVSACPNCSISLTLHRKPERLVCHYCQHSEAPGITCPKCGGETLKQRGMGTQQIEQLICERFPSARVARMDVDTTTGKWAHTEILDRVGSGEVDILLGTQMIAKGLDFPNVTLVGVIDADVGINLPDFRASERCFQLLSQVAGRAGRGPKGGEVLIQTRVPNHHAVRYALAHDYESFVKEELEGRKDPPYPPNLRLANIVFSGLKEVSTAQLAVSGTNWLKKLIKARGGDYAGQIAIVGPAPCPIERIKTRWRWHVLLKSDNPAEMTRVLRYFLEKFGVPQKGGLRVTVDRDPVSLM